MKQVIAFILLISVACLLCGFQQGKILAPILQGAPAAGGATPTLLHSASHACTTGVTTCPVTITATTAGSTLVATAVIRNDTAQTLTSFTDGASQSWSFAKNTGNIATHAIVAIGYFCNTASGVTTVNANWATANDGVIAVEEWGNMAVSCFDAAATQDTVAITQTWTSANSTTTTHASDVLIGVVYNNLNQSITQTGSNGWTNDINVGSSNSGFSMGMAYKVVSSTGAYTNSGSASSAGTNNYPGSAAFKGQ